ncbi:lysylphosphatidylglycerol synthase transmembrane domain-containing protein [Dysgonomonas sp. GY617]|uniref:lysylphosphatidylglycerol synthase transmembrane domain-containing protein n=1 Tax=Dysgonomonas sp. GY617 TaxID=2780420 RepID=UPI0018836DA4|nr:lysylphosphatidylglycerol synthase transmembrane domain-containing protein [Dysgonomonas sp. GY617]MBF0576502.1 flippase-like domain-containing protein [Dysgonomonas sp. GY617]
MTGQSTKISKWKILIPTLLGVGVIVYMFSKDLLGQENAQQLAELRNVKITWDTVFWFFIALLLMVGRDLGFTIRYRYLTEKVLSWKQSLKITLLAEFGTAVTPSSVGGSSMAVLFLSKENISVGRSTAMVFVTMLLDEMFFVVTFPLLLLFVPVDELFPEISTLQMGVISLFIAAYIIKMIICICLIIGLFFKPQAIRWLLIKIFRLPILRRWHAGAVKAGDDLIISAREIRGKKFSYWWPLILATILSWASRFLVVNALFMAFFSVSDHMLIFARQFVMWVLMILSFTPGASGLSEIIFKHYLSALIPISGLIPVIIVLWRLLSYYNYLFIGAFLVPRWASKAFTKTSKSEEVI